MANKKVNISERVKVHGKWTSTSVEIPKLKSDNTLYLKDKRQGKFKLSWYEGKKNFPEWSLLSRSGFNCLLCDPVRKRAGA